MIFWRTFDWQPEYRLWHDLLHDVCGAQKMHESMRMAKKPKLAGDYREKVRILSSVLANLLQVALLQNADAPPEQMLPHVTTDDAVQLALTRLHERLQERADDVVAQVMLKLGEVMTARRCDPTFPKLKTV